MVEAWSRKHWIFCRENHTKKDVQIWWKLVVEDWFEDSHLVLNLSKREECFSCALGNLVFTEQTTHISYCQKKSNSFISVRAPVLGTNGLFSNLWSFQSLEKSHVFMHSSGRGFSIYLNELCLKNYAEEFHTPSTEFNFSKALPPLQTQSWLKETSSNPSL